jgi:hypothetical protein
MTLGDFCDLALTASVAKGRITTQLLLPDRDPVDLIRDIRELPLSFFDRLYFPTPYRLSNSSVITDTTPYNGSAPYLSHASYVQYYLNLGFAWERAKNVYCMHFGGIYFGGHLYYYDFMAQRSKPSSQYTVWHFDTIFSFLHRWFYYGHYIIDYLPVVSAISSDLQRSCLFIVRLRSVFSVSALRLFGVPDDHIVWLPYGTAAFGRHVILIRPLQMQRMNAALLEKMRSIFVARLELDKQPPFRYVLYNRKGKRHASNLHRLFKHVRPMFPRIAFELYQDEVQFEFRNQFRYFNEMLVLFGCHGSGTLNAIFQQSNTVFVVVESKQSDGNLFVAIAKIFRRHAFLHRDYEFDHFARSIKLQVKFVFPLLEMGIRRAIRIAKNYRPVESASPPPEYVLGPGFVLMREDAGT